MLNMIKFPNIGLEFNVGSGISIFGLFEISYYGILMSLAILVGMAVILFEARYTGQRAEDYLELAIVTIPAAIIGARIFYVLFSWDVYKGAFLKIFAIWQGGLAFYGGLIAGVIAVIFFAKIRMLWSAEMLDTACLGVLAGQVIANWGSYFNREAIGEYTNGLFAMQLPIDALRIVDVTDRMRNHITEIDGVRFVQAHPVFLYESIWCLILLCILIVYRYNKEFDGEIFCLYIAGYSLGRIWMEGLRVDSLKLPFVGWSVSRVLAVIFLIISVAMVIYNRMQNERGRKRRIRQKNAKNSLKSSKNMFHGM